MGSNTKVGKYFLGSHRNKKMYLCMSNLLYMCTAGLRSHTSSNRIKLSQFVLDIFSSIFTDLGFFSLGAGQVDGGIWDKQHEYI